VYEEQEFERLGSGRTHKVDVRLVAESNRNLVKMVARGQFRVTVLSSECLPRLAARCESAGKTFLHCHAFREAV